MISTNRPLNVQRFTGAHELGHLVMNHQLSLDDEDVLAGRKTDIIELEANAFAAEFLLPRWLFVLHAKIQGWNAETIVDPAIAYQLSLRVGASYEATVRSLEKHKIIEPEQSRSLLRISPKTIKQKLVPGYNPDHWHRDVWVITERDEGALIEGQPEDLFLFRLNEKTGAGYLWDFQTLKERGFAIVADERRDMFPEEMIGGGVLRLLTAHSPAQVKGNLRLLLRRPWQKSDPAAEQIRLRYNLQGKEVGLPRARRPDLAIA